MIHVDEKIVKALCNLENNPDFKVIQQWFLDSEAEQARILRSAESATLVYRAQGASKELLEFCSLCANPREVASKMAMNKAGIFLPE